MIPEKLFLEMLKQSPGRRHPSRTALSHFLQQHQELIAAGLRHGYSVGQIYRTLESAGSKPPVGERQFRRALNDMQSQGANQVPSPLLSEITTMEKTFQTPESEKRRNDEVTPMIPPNIGPRKFHWDTASSDSNSMTNFGCTDNSFGKLAKNE